MIAFLARNVKWFLGTFIGIVLFLVFVLPQFWPSYSQWMSSLFADISVKATPQFVITSTEHHYLAYQTAPLKIKVIDWIHVEISWPCVDTAVEYMLRSGNGDYPDSILGGNLVYQGDELTTITQRSMNVRFTLFYKDTSGNWCTAYRGHIKG